MTDRNPAEIMYPNHRAPGSWRIELKYLPIAHRGHAFLALVDPDGKIVQELHGLSRSKHTDEIMDMGMDGSDLVARQDRRLEGATKSVSTVASGSVDEIGKIWARGAQAARLL